jgi:UDP-galactopyranose mutase
MLHRRERLTERSPGGTRPESFDLLCISHLRWDFVWQRPQQLLSRFARQRRVVFVEEPLSGEGPARLERARRGESVTLVTPHLPAGLPPDRVAGEQARLLEELAGELGRFVLWLYTPMAVDYTRGLGPLAVVYDCMDELSAFALAPDHIAEREAELFDLADLVFTGGASLYEAKRGRHHDVHLYPSSVDTAHFATARAVLSEPREQRRLPRPRLGYMGVVDERMDLDLVSRIAAAEPGWQVVLLGPHAKIDPAQLPQAPNIHYLGQRAYEELPSYLAGWDVGLMPFARNEATRFISPTKTPEYLAAGLPVVSTPIADVVRPYGEAGLVRIAKSAEEFLESCRAAMSEDRDARLRRVDASLTESSWDYTWADMNEHLERVVLRASLRNGRVSPRLPARPDPVDCLVVGAGFAGSVVAERLASEGARVLVVDRRSHVGGNAYDHYDDAGILVHRYGPHIFHTNSREVFEYLSRFTEWRRYEHRVLASIGRQLVPFPINLDTVNRLYGLELTPSGLEEFFASVAEPRRPPLTSEDVVVSKIGRVLYETFFQNYTRKMWGLDPSQLDASVAARVPARLDRDDRYFTDTYQAMPLHGFTRLFERLLSHPRIDVQLGTDYRDLQSVVEHDRLVFTGPIDEYFGHRFGELPYRSLAFRFETRPVEQALPVAVVNHPNEHDYTRVTEFKHLTGQRHPSTTLVYEYPREEGDPYYPVPRPENDALYKEYRSLAEATPDVSFVGRLATYKYYNMDQVVAQALAVARRLLGRESRAEAAARADHDARLAESKTDAIVGERR